MARVLWFASLIALVGCVYVGQSERGPSTFAMPKDANSRLGRLLEGVGDSTDSTDRALVVDDATLALTSRLDLIDAAEVSVDVQYFIWQNDPSGILLIDHLLAAADRGVRVRALVDDVQLEGLVSKISTIDEHPNIEVRIFNPFSLRLGVPLLLSGDIVPELSAGFDAYWNSGWAVHSDQLLRIEWRSDSLAALRERIRTRLGEFPRLVALADPDRIERLLAELQLSPALDDAFPVVDTPDLSWGEKPDEIAVELTRMALSVEHEVLIVSPYLVLTPTLLDLGQTLISKGVRVAVITNSLASNDVVIAHAAYARYRKAILDTGAELYEFRGDAQITRQDQAEAFSLHSKFIVFDGRTVFLGSLNLDPRSLYLNTELGVILESESLAEVLTSDFDRFTRGENAWRVTRSEDGFRWQSSDEVLDRQPAKSTWQRFRSWLMMFLPLTNQI